MDYDVLVIGSGPGGYVAAIRALREIGLEHCMPAQQTGWVLYLNGPADLTVLQAFARRLGHARAVEALQRPLVHYVPNSIAAVERHFQALAAFVPDVRGCVLLDGPSGGAEVASGVTALRWRKGKIHDYVLTGGALEAYAVKEDRSKARGPLFASDQADTRLESMREAIDASQAFPARKLGTARRGDGDWTALESVFRCYRRNPGIEDDTSPPTAEDLVEGLPESEIDPGLREKLDAVAAFGAGA